MIPITVRFYSSTAPEVTLTAGVNNVDGVIVVSSTTGFPLTTPYTLALDYGGATEELVEVTGVAGTSLTVTRAIDGTSAASHGAGAKVRHVSSARDFKDSRDHENASTNIHGLGVGVAVVGDTKVQTLTNKTLDTPTLDGTVTATGDVNVAGSIDVEGAVDIGSGPSPFTGSLSLFGAATIQGGMTVTTDLGTAPHLEVTKGLGTTGPLQKWTDLGGITTLAVVGGDGSFDSTSADVTTTSLMTAATGWSIAANTIGVVKNGMISINGNVTRTGANITIDAAGSPSTGITPMATVLAPYRQKSTMGTLYFHAGNSIATGTCRMASAGGTIELVRWQASQTISTGNSISFTLTYPLS